FTGLEPEYNSAATISLLTPSPTVTDSPTDHVLQSVPSAAAPLSLIATAVTAAAAGTNSTRCINISSMSITSSSSSNHLVNGHHNSPYGCGIPDVTISAHHQ